ncbi:MAG: MFS transporter, partial [Myxococcota bacterium]
MSRFRQMLLANVPFRPARVPFYYGWIVVGAATIGILASIPGQTMGVSVFTDPLLEATGLSRLSLSNAYLVGTLGSAAMLPAAGRWLDRLGVRLGAMLAALGLGTVVLALASVEDLVRLGGSVLPAEIAAFGTLALLFVGVRFTGQGVLTLASRTMLGRWFDRRRGTATAVSGLFVAFGFAIAPRALDAWIIRSGWSGAYREIAMVEMIGMVAVAWLLFREEPESAGLVVDGGATVPEADTVAEEPSATRDEALRTRAFWVLTLALAWHGLVLTGITMHIVDLG